MPTDSTNWWLRCAECNWRCASFGLHHLGDRAHARVDREHAAVDQRPVADQRGLEIGRSGCGRPGDRPQREVAARIVTRPGALEELGPAPLGVIGGDQDVGDDVA